MNFSDAFIKGPSFRANSKGHFIEGQSRCWLSLK